jgi:hypothetical protein
MNITRSISTAAAAIKSSAAHADAGHLKKLTPRELHAVKGQIGALLNYCTSGGAPASISAETRAKITRTDVDGLLSKIRAALLGVQK